MLNKLNLMMNNYPKKKVIIHLMILLIPVLFIISSVAVYSGKYVIEKTATRELKGIAYEASENVSKFIQGRLNILQVLADDSIIKDKNIPLESQLDKLKILSKSMKILNAGICDENGNYYSIKLKKPVNISKRFYYKYVVNGESVVTEPMKSKIDNTTIMVYSVPIFKKNKVIGCIIAELDGNTLLDLCDSIQFGNTGEAYIIGKKGDIVAHINEGYVINKENFIKKAKRDKRFVDIGCINQKMVKGENGVAEYSFKGTRKYIAYAPIKDRQWSIAITIHKSEVLKELVTFINVNIGVAALLAIVIPILGGSRKVCS